MTSRCTRWPSTPRSRAPKTRSPTGLVKLKEEDESFTYGNDPETKELIIAGVGDMQLSVLMAKLQSKYKVEAVLKPAKIAYRETIKKKVEIHGRHKKQSGGHGQFGDVYIRFEPQSESEEMIFADETVGGCVPKNFIPSVEKGLRNCVGKGVLAGYPVVFLKATLYFGSYHPVDSSDMAFQTAAGIAYKEGLPTAGPTLLEPIGELKVLIPDSNMGDVIGDLNKRRGRVMGMNPDPENPGYQIVEAEVPDRRNDLLFHRPARHEPGPRQLHAEVRPLRGSPADEPGQDHRRRQEGRGRIIPNPQQNIKRLPAGEPFSFDSPYGLCRGRCPHRPFGRAMPAPTNSITLPAANVGATIGRSHFPPHKKRGPHHWCGPRCFACKLLGVLFLVGVRVQQGADGQGDALVLLIDVDDLRVELPDPRTGRPPACRCGGPRSGRCGSGRRRPE